MMAFVGGADIVGHIEEEGTLSLISGIGGYHGVLQSTCCRASAIRCHRRYR